MLHDSHIDKKESIRQKEKKESSKKIKHNTTIFFLQKVLPGMLVWMYGNSWKS
jgi:hypothetical protein